MTKQTQSTDAELMPCPFCGTQPDECDIGQFVVECPSCAIVGPASDNSNAARRAWNTRWGTPAGAGEPKRVFIVATGEDHEGEATYTRYDDAPPPLCDSECLYTTPQPTQAQASFKSGAKSFQTYAEANAYSKGYYAGKKAATKAQAGAVPLATYRAYALIDSMGWALDDQEKDDMLRLLRATEAAHGIKGADHA